MTMKKNIALALSSAALILSVGCSDSSSSNEETTTGTAIDGYLSGATACIDANNDGVANDAVCVQTDEFGEYNLPAGLVAANPVAITGGTDVLTNEKYVGSMSAPAGATVVTPLTTLVNAVVKKAKAEGKTVTAQDAQKTVSKALGLDENTDLVNLDPIRATVEGDTTTANAAKVVIAVQTKVQVIQQTLATTIKSASGDAVEESDAASAVADQMAAIITTAAADTTGNTSAAVSFSATDLYNIVTKAVTAVAAKVATTNATASAALTTALTEKASTLTSVATDTATNAATIETTIKNATDVKTVADESAKVVKVANVEVKEAVQTAITNNTTVVSVDVTTVAKTKTVAKSATDSINPNPATTGAAN